MAKEYYGRDRGQTQYQVVFGAATTGKGVEVVVDLSQNWSTGDLLQALMDIYNFIISSNNWPPA